MNETARELIHRLRNDEYTRTHFNMNNWQTPGCSTVGCLAGTAILMEDGAHHGANFLLFHSGDGIIARGAEILGLPSARVGTELFLPDFLATMLNNDAARYYEVLGQNERPGAQQIQDMIEWARRFNSHKLTPDVCASVLESTLVQERQFVLWSEHAC